MKKEYQELQQKLTMKYSQPKGGYGVVGGLKDWLMQNNIEPTNKHLDVLYKIFGSLPYVYVEADRKEILLHLTKYDYKGVLVCYTKEIV